MKDGQPIKEEAIRYCVNIINNFVRDPNSVDRAAYYRMMAQWEKRYLSTIENFAQQADVQAALAEVKVETSQDKATDSVLPVQAETSQDEVKHTVPPVQSATEKPSKLATIRKSLADIHERADQQHKIDAALIEMFRQHLLTPKAKVALPPGMDSDPVVKHCADIH